MSEVLWNSKCSCREWDLRRICQDCDKGCGSYVAGSIAVADGCGAPCVGGPGRVRGLRMEGTTSGKP